MNWSPQVSNPEVRYIPYRTAYAYHTSTLSDTEAVLYNLSRVRGARGGATAGARAEMTHCDTLTVTPLFRLCAAYSVRRTVVPHVSMSFRIAPKKEP